MKLPVVVVAVVLPVPGPMVKLVLVEVADPVPGPIVKLLLVELVENFVPVPVPVVLFQFVVPEVRVPGLTVELPWDPVPVKVGLGEPVPVGKGAVLFQSSHGDPVAEGSVQVLIRVYVPFVRVQQRGPVAVGPVTVPFEVTVPLGKGAPAVGGIVPLEVPVPVGTRVPVGLDKVALVVAVLLGNDTVEEEVLMCPTSLLFLLAVAEPVQQLLFVIVMELVMVEVTR